MADDWQVGDLAWCVRGGPWEPSDDDGWTTEWPESGCIYKVEAVGLNKFVQGTDVALWLHDGPMNYCWDENLQRVGEKVWSSLRFRKIKPLSDDEEMEYMRQLGQDARRELERN